MLRYLDIDEEDFKLVQNQISENVKKIRKEISKNHELRFFFRKINLQKTRS